MLYSRILTMSLAALVVTALSSCAANRQSNDAFRTPEASRTDISLSGPDRTLNGHRDNDIGGFDTAIVGNDTALGGRDSVLNAGGGTALRRNDTTLNPPGAKVPPLVAPDVPKRDLQPRELQALSVTLARAASDPNSFRIKLAKIDDTNNAVRFLCAWVHDLRLDATNNRYNVVFGIIEARPEGKFLVSVIDSGQRASVACERMGYLDAA